MQEADLSGLDFSGANFNRSHLEGNNFKTSNLNNTSFLEADLTGAIFDANNSIFAGE